MSRYRDSRGRSIGTWYSLALKIIAKARLEQDPAKRFDLFDSARVTLNSSGDPRADGLVAECRSEMAKIAAAKECAELGDGPCHSPHGADDA